MRHKEDEEQQAIFTWAKYTSIGSEKVSDYLFHIPNGGLRNKREAARLKRQGVKAGVSDMFLPIPMRGYAGLWVELKAKEGVKPTASQKEWIDKMVSVGYSAKVCYGSGEAIKVIKEYLGI